MKIYAEYEYYVEEFGAKMSAAEFKRYSRDASAYIKRATLGRSETYEGEELKLATCAVAEAYCDVDKTCIGGRMIASENNDGHTISFSNAETDTEALKAKKAYQAMSNYLAGTGLLSRRVSRNDYCGF